MEIFNPPCSLPDMPIRIADPKLKGADHRSAPTALNIICAYPEEQRNNDLKDHELKLKSLRKKVREISENEKKQQSAQAKYIN